MHMMLRRGLSGTAAGRPPTALVLMNLGGPATQEDVHPFLLRLFSDSDLIQIPFQSMSSRFIARRRTPSVQGHYAKIGGGSPIGMWTEKQGRAAASQLDTLCPSSSPHKAYTAFRYATPLTADMIAQLKADGVRRAIAFTQYPQYSCSTTGSSLNELVRQLRVHDPEGSISWSLIDRWGQDRLLAKAFAQLIRDGLERFPADVRDSVVVLFSAHSLPMSVVNRGDTYPTEVAQTAQRVMEELGAGHVHRVIWQSAVGPRAWLGPATEASLKGLPRVGVRNALLVPIAFTSDHIETLFELDLDYIPKAKEWGFDNLRRTESLNDHPAFIECLASLAARHIEGTHDTSKDFAVRCANCTNSACDDTRHFFAKA